MLRYVAFLRGVSPMNAEMPELKRCFEAAGFSDVRTVLSSGNVVFSSRSSKPTALERRAEKVMQFRLGHSFGTLVRSTEYLEDLIESDPFSAFSLPPGAKRVITFLRHPRGASLALPIERDGARILKVTEGEVCTAYVPSDKGAPRS